MKRFAFIIHPIEPQRDIARKYPLLGQLPLWIIDYFSHFFPRVCLSHIDGIRSNATGEEGKGWMIACPLTPRGMRQLPISSAYKKTLQAGHLAERLGAQILGLGAFASAIEDAGQRVSKHVRIPIKRGNSYTMAVAMEASLQAARQSNGPYNLSREGKDEQGTPTHRRGRY
jgi:predicted amino acid dehydrogenase